MSKFSFLTRTIWIVSLISLFTDISSEILYPVMPIYLKTIGFSALIIGILEGFAEATAGLSKGYFGKLSDLSGKRVPFVRLGYFMSSLAKPMFAISVNILWIFSARFMDRLGKGVRTGARDAILSGETSRENKGKVFGFHRGMDTLGAAIGPIIALIYLAYYPENYITLFLIAFIPAIAGVFLTFFIKDEIEKADKIPDSSKYNFFSYFSYWNQASPQYRKLLTGLLAFTLFNSSDVFLLLMAKNQGLSDTHVIGAYVFYNLVYALFSYPMGSLGDKIGMKPTFMLGLLFFIIVYSGMAFANDIKTVYFLFFIYGIYASCNEGISKAWISNLAPKNETATAIGLYSSLSSIFTMISSSLAGLIWVVLFPSSTFIFSASGVFLVLIYFNFMKAEKK